jgi:phosphatidylglycerol lysyltransferase
MLFAGLALLQVSRNLARRKELAWWVATVALVAAFFSQVTAEEFEPQHVLVTGLLLVYMLAFRRQFNARSDPTTLRRALVTAPVLALAVVAYGYQGLRALDAHFVWPPDAQPPGVDHALEEARVREAIRGGILMSGLEVRPADKQAERFLASLEVAGWLARLYVLVLLLRPVILRDRREAPPEDVERIRRAHGAHSVSAFALRPDKHHLLVVEGRGLVAYAVRNAVAVSCGAPLCAPEDLAESVREFVEHCRGHGWTPCLYAVRGEDLSACAAVRLKALKTAAEAVLDPRAVASSPPPSDAFTVWRYDRGATVDTVLDEQIVEVSDEWLAARKLEELHFTLGSLDVPELASLAVFVCGRPERLEAFCTFRPYAEGRGMALDLLRRREEAGAACREVLLSQALRELAASGVREVSLGQVPVGATDGARGETGPFGLAERLGSIYGDDEFLALKKAFAPRWEPRHLVYARDSDLPRVAVAVVDVHTTLHERSPIPRLIAAFRALRRRAAGGRAR